MKIKDILQAKGSKVWMVRENETIQDVLHVLVSQKIGAILVSDEKGEKIAGIISERDIVRGAFSWGDKLSKMPVSKLMTRHVIVGSPEDDITQVMDLMTEKRLRHLPVVDGGRLRGIVSIGDVVKILMRDAEHEIRHLKEYMYGGGTEISQ